ncbi:MAG: caspase family protein [Bacteroidota bacterium]
MSVSHAINLPFARSHAFVIGINDYQHVSHLKTAVNDAQGIAQRLVDEHGYEVHGPLLNPTKAELDKLLFETMPQVVGAEDRIVFYFAGHGIALDGEEGPNGYIVPLDAKPGDKETLIPMDALNRTLHELPCRHGLLILDCCFSGAFKWSTGFRDIIFDLPKVVYEERFWRYVKDPAWQVITSSAYDQKAVDVISDQSIGMRGETQGQHSPFAHALFDALEGAADIIPAEQGDGVITASELYTFLRDAVENQTADRTKSQSPSMFNLAKHDKGEFIFLNPRHRFNLPPTPDRNPFMGLASYNEGDSHYFFGRDSVTEALIEKVTQNPLTVVSGASGTGKSSVIKAGLLPQLRKAGWTLMEVIRPGKEPMKVLQTEIGDIASKLHGDQPSLLIVDQYEELITQCLRPEDRIAFEKQLAQWLNQHPQLRIILSIRSDFEPQFERETLAKWWQAGKYVVPSFSLDEIREVITRPAAQAVLFYEPEELVEKLCEEVSQAPGALPLLSFTLSELYHAYLKSGRQDRALSGEDYQQLGGVIGALRTRANAEYDQLAPAEQASMQKLMLRMVSVEAGELAGKRVYVEELHYNDAAESMRMQQIADQLVNARLLLKGKDAQGRTFIEPAHDALVRAWARLWEWIKAVGEDNIGLRASLSQAVSAYQDMQQTEPKKARNLLWNNHPKLATLKGELQGKNHWLNSQEEGFVQASIQRKKVRQRSTWSIGVGVAAALGILGFFAYTQTQTAAENDLNDQLSKLENAARGSMEQDHLRAFRLAEAGLHLSRNNDRNPDNFSNLLIRSAYSNARFSLEDKGQFSEDAIRPASSARSNRLVKANGILKELNSRGDTIWSYDLRRDSAQIARKLRDDYTVRSLINLTDWQADKSYIVPNGKYVVLVGWGNESVSWHIICKRRGEFITYEAQIPDDDYEPFLFDQQGKIFVTRPENGTFKIFENGTSYQTETAFPNQTSFMALSPSGNYLAAGSQTGNIKVFDMREPRSSAYLGEIYSFPFPGTPVISKISFCNRETVLKTETQNQTKYWPLKGDLTTQIDINTYYADADIEVTDAYSGEKIFIKQIRELQNLSLSPTGLETNLGEHLVDLHHPVPGAGEEYLMGFSEDGRYFFFYDKLYPIGPDLLLDRVNQGKIWQGLASVDISEFTGGQKPPSSPVPAPTPTLATTQTTPNPQAAEEAASETSPAEPQGASRGEHDIEKFEVGIITGDRVNIRRQPSLQAEKLDQLNKGKRVEIFNILPYDADGYTWVRITYDGKIGWVVTKFLDRQ